MIFQQKYIPQAKYQERNQRNILERIYVRKNSQWRITFTNDCFLFSFNVHNECEVNDFLEISECRVFLSQVFQVQKCRVQALRVRVIDLDTQSHRFMTPNNWHHRIIFSKIWKPVLYVKLWTLKAKDLQLQAFKVRDLYPYVLTL